MESQRRLIAICLLGFLVGWAGWSYTHQGIVDILMNDSLDAVSKLTALKMMIAGWGPYAPFAYIMFCVIEVVVIPIPGIVLYMPGGIIFGGFWGGTLSLIGNTIGAGISCLLVRCLLRKDWRQHFFSERQLNSYEAILKQRGLLAVILLRINPLTSSDLISYACGLTNISTFTVMLGTALGMAPLCYIQAYLSMELFTAFPWLVWPMALLFTTYAIMIIYVIFNIKKTTLHRSK